MIAQTNVACIDVLGSEIAKRNIVFTFELLGLELSASSIDWYFSKVLQSWGWFKIEKIRDVPCYELKVFHNYGLKWSLFLNSYMIGVYETILRERPRITISDRVVKINHLHKRYFEPEQALLEMQ